MRLDKFLKVSWALLREELWQMRHVMQEECL